MKKHVLLAKTLKTMLFTGVLSWGSLSSVNAQVATNYTFSQSIGTYTPITGGTLIATATPDATQDDDVYSATIPFNFVFDGNVQTSIFISTNGFISFGATNPGASNWAPISSPTAYAGAVSPFGRDLQGGYATEVTRTLGSNQITVSNVGPITVGSTIQNGGGFPNGTTVTAISGNVLTMSNTATSSATNAMTAFYGPWSEIRVETLGTSPNRIFVVQWQNWRRFGLTPTTTRNMVLNFQVRLYEADNSIECVYGNCSPGTNTTITTVNQVGLRGPNNTFATNVNNRLNVKGTSDWATSTPGTSNTSGQVFNTVAPANVIPNGLTYRWELVSCLPPGGLTASMVSVTEGNFSWNIANPVPGVGYEYAITTSPTPPVSGTPTTALGFNDNTLNPNTNYWLHVRSECSPGVYSSWNTLAFNTIPGNTCSLPIVINSFPYSAGHTTCGSGNDYGIQCSGLYGGGQDLVFALNITTTGTYQIQITGPTSWIGWFLKDGSNCANAPSCLASATSGSGTIATGTYNFTSPGTYYLIVDTWPAPDCGAFNLAINPPSPPPGCASNFVVTPHPSCDNFPLTISWGAVTGATGYKISLGTTPGGNQILNLQNIGNVLSYTFNNPSINTTYYYTITPYNLGGDAVGCVEQQFTTGPVGCHCVPSYTSGKTLGDLISQVTIPGTTLNNLSGTQPINPAYTYFTGQPNYTANLVQGGTYNVTIAVGTWGNQHIRAWIDYNDDGTFDPSESIGSTVIAPGLGNTGPFPPAVFPVTLANNAPLGTHRMRIRGVWNTTPNFHTTIDPCATYSWGETEDYDITIVPPVITQLQAGSCGATNVAPNQLLFAVNVGAPVYRFRFNGPNNGGPGWNNNTFIVDRPNRYVYFNHLVPGFQFGATYSVDVAVGDGNGNFGPYGTACNVTLQSNVPLTQIQASQCGSTVNGNTLIFANQIFDAQGYRFRITGPNDGSWPGGVFILDRPVRYFYFNNLVPGATPGATFTVEVAYLQNDGQTYSPYGPVCNVTLNAPLQSPIIENNDIFVDNKTMRVVEFGANASHNPFTTDFGIQVLNANDVETINVSIYDMSGKLIERNAVHPMDIENARFGAKLASGMYMIEVRQGANQVVIRQVKN